ncbi:hypothetical protein ACFP3T_13520 [Lactiplantibacillus dongliensis]|uniref:Uncharacterized protein n=1 Tax=Lactiplantibacillus dongliensis TaxID=2559919 RepID=A0ABW1RBV6_9LACO|nr:hypothetical protein [Lactiplantibacillus dongliensis]
MNRNYQYHVVNVIYDTKMKTYMTGDLNKTFSKHGQYQSLDDWLNTCIPSNATLISVTESFNNIDIVEYLVTYAS